MRPWLKGTRGGVAYRGACLAAALALVFALASPLTAAAKTPSTPVPAPYTISGSVASLAASAPVGLCKVEIWDEAGNWITDMDTSSAGKWSVLVPEGFYYVTFNPAVMDASTGAKFVGGTYNSANPPTNLTTTGLFDGELLEVGPVVGSLTNAVNVKLDTGCTVHGHVTGSSLPLQNAYVTARDLSDTEFANTFTAADGSFSMVLPVDGPSPYVKIEPPSGTPYLPRYYNLALTIDMATQVPLTKNATVTLTTQDLPQGGYITGNVRKPGGLTPAATVSVSAMPLPGLDMSMKQTLTAADGSYTLGPLEPGPCAVYFDPNWGTQDASDSFNALNGTKYVAQAYNNARLDMPTTITVNSGAIVSGVNDTLWAGTSVAVKVQNLAGTPVNGVGCEIQGQSFFATSQEATSVAPSGTVTFTGLPYDSYGIKCDPSQPGGYDDKANANFKWSWYDPFVLNTPTKLTPALPFYLDYGGEISGAVKVGATGIAKIEVAADLADGNDTPVYNYTNASGAYKLHGVPPARIKVHFPTYDFNTSHNTDYVEEWWDRKWTFRTADVIDVLAVDPAVPGQGFYPNRNANLTHGSQVSGTITAPGAIPEDSAYVQLFDAYGNSVDSQYSGDPALGAGKYKFRAVAPGIYRVSAQSEFSLPERWWIAAPSYATATNLLTVAGADYLANIALADGPSLDGRVVKYGTTTGIAGVIVSIRDANGVEQGQAITGPTGYWALSGPDSWQLVPGKYRVHFEPNPADTVKYGAAYYRAGVSQSATTAAAATELTLGYGTVTHLVDGRLTSAGLATVHGHVVVRGTTTNAWEPGTSIFVSAWEKIGAKWQRVASVPLATTAGTFDIPGLTPGVDYRICMEDEAAQDKWGTYGRQFWVSANVNYASVSWPEMASMVKPPASGIYNLGYFPVQKGGLFIVKTLDLNFDPLENVDVFMDFYNPITHKWWPVDGGYMGYSMASGELDLPTEQFYDVPLMPGDYRFRFERYGHDTVWYQDAPGAASATTVTLPPFITGDWNSATWVEQVLTPSDLTTDQVVGLDRYDVAAQLARDGHPAGFAGVKNVVIASGLDRSAADPLSASGIAGVYNAPLVLVRQDRPVLPTASAKVLHDIAAANPTSKIAVWIVGGPASVPEALKAQITLALGGVAHTGVYTRFTGIDRYAVATGVAAHVRAKTGTKSCFVTNGSAPAYFWDSLAVSPVAYKMHFPILLVRSTYCAPTTLAEAQKYTARYVIGDATHISEAVRAQMGADRISGGNRADVARRFSEIAWSRGWIGLAKVAIGNKLADSLAGGITYGALGGTMLYTGDGVTKAWSLSPETRQFLENYRAHVTDVHLLGGSGSIAPTLSVDVNTALGR